MELITIDGGGGGKTTFPILSLAILPPLLQHTHLFLSLSCCPSLPLSHCLSISEPAAALTVREETLFSLTAHRVEPALTRRQTKTHTHTHASQDNRRWTEAPAIACPLAAVRHVGGGDLLSVPCLLQSSKHLPSPPERSLPGSAVAEGLAGMTQESGRHKEMR